MQKTISSSTFFLFSNPCWLLPATFLLLCLKTFFRIICSITFPVIEMRLPGLYLHISSFSPSLKTVIFSLYQYSGTFPSCHDFWKRKEGRFSVTLISSLSTHGWIQLVFTECIHRFPKWFSSRKAVVFVLAFPTGLKPLGLLKDKTRKDQVEGSIQSLSPLTTLSFVSRCTIPFSSRHISSSLPFVVDTSAEDLVAQHVPRTKI